MSPSRADPPLAPVPRSALQYLRSFGPGIVIVLTWLGAGDVVDMGVAGANYGYSLMWVLVLAVFMRFVLVSLIARYHLCNQHGESVIDGLCRLHPVCAPILAIATVVMAHVYSAYMTVGVGEVCANLFRAGEPWVWALGCNAIALGLVFRPAYVSLERVFKIFLALLSISFIGSAIFVGLSPIGVLQGLFRFEMPDAQGRFNPLLVGVAMIGAVGGSIMNLVYTYFLDAKGWRGPQYWRLQLYDFLLAMTAMLVLNLAVWTLGAELLYPDRQIHSLDDLPTLISAVLGEWGRALFYVGIFSAIYTSILGHATGLATLGTHAWLRWRVGSAPETTTLQQHALYRALVVWFLVPPLIWALPGMPDFVTLTLMANGAQVVIVPLLAGGLWRITASSRFIGPRFRTRPWENIVMALLFLLALYAAVNSVVALIEHFEGY
ncbi:MAG: Nramp family divalent metal transporter [Vicinamibacteraceae bacterium]